MTTLLLTRPEAQSRAFADLCRAAGFGDSMVIAPVLDIVPLVLDVDPADFATLLFTSANAVGATIAQADLAGRPALAVGARTAQAARDAGADCISAGGTVEDLLALILRDPPAQPLLHLRGVHSRGDLAARLGASGLKAAETVVYDQRARALGPTAEAILGRPGPVILPLFSPRSARLVGAQLAQLARVRAPLFPVALSPAVAAAWAGPGRCTVAARPDAGAMIAAILGNSGA